MSTTNLEKAIKLIKKHQPEKFAQCLQDPSLDINQLDPKSGKTLIQLSIQSDEQQIFEMLLKTKGIKLETTSKTGETILETAIIVNSVFYVEQLLRAKYNIKQKGSQGFSGIFVAIKSKCCPEIISKIIGFGGDLDQEVEGVGGLLDLAIVEDNFQSFQVLINHPKIDIKITDDEDNTCLIRSVKEKKGNFVQAILKKIGEKSNMSDMDKQFFVNACDKNGDTALHIAAKRNYQTILDILTREAPTLGIDLQAKNKQGKTYKQLFQQVLQQYKKQRRNEQYNQKKRAEQKQQKHKQKEEERARILKQQEQQAIAQKKRKKEQQKIDIEQRELAIKMEKNRKIWIVGIFLVVVFGAMYLAFLSAVNKPKTQ